MFSEDSLNPTTRRGLIRDDQNDSYDFDDLAEKTKPKNMPKNLKKTKSIYTNETSEVEIKNNPNSEKGDVASNLGGKSDRSHLTMKEKRKNNKERPLSEILGPDFRKGMPMTNDPTAYFEDKEDKEEA